MSMNNAHDNSAVGGRSAGKRGLFWRRFGKAGLLHVLLALMCFTMALPFVWMVFTSLKPLAQVGLDAWLPTPEPELRGGDLSEPVALLRAWRDADNPVSARLWAMLSPGSRAELERLAVRAETDDVRQTLRNRLIGVWNNELNPSDAPQLLYEEAAFANVTLRSATRRVLRQLSAVAAAPADVDLDVDARPRLTPEQTALVRLANRYLVEDAYAGLVQRGQAFQWGNYLRVFEVIPFARFYWNSIFVASWVTFLKVFTSSLAAFSFSRIDWPGRDKVFLLYLGTMMVPGTVMMIPNYQIMISLGLVDTYLGLILPGAFTAFGTFLLRQFMMTIPSSLDEAAEIDGASKWRIYWDVILPLSRPGLITLTIFTFLGEYRGFFWPMVMLKTVDKYTLPIGMLYFDSTRGQSTHLLMAAVTMSVVPMIILFIVLQKYLVKGIQLGAVKG